MHPPRLRRTPLFRLLALAACTCLLAACAPGRDFVRWQGSLADMSPEQLAAEKADLTRRIESCDAQDFQYENYNHCLDPARCVKGDTRLPPCDSSELRRKRDLVEAELRARAAGTSGPAAPAAPAP